MAASLKDLKAPALHAAWIAAVLLCGCTTTTTLVTGDDTGAPRGARSAPSSSSPHSTPSFDYVVERGDTLYSIAFRQRVDLRELIAWNRLAEPYTIYPGQRLRIARAPERRADVARAFPHGEPVPTEPLRVAGGRLQESPTASAVPRAQPATAASPARVEAAARPVSSMPAIPIAVDEGVREAAIDETWPAQPPAPASTAAGPTPSAATGPGLPQTPVAPPAWPQTPVEPSREMLAVRSAPTRMVGGIGWRWPNGAALVGRFAADDEARQGIRLQGAPGTEVNASADGEVVYSGNGLVGLGELVIIKHGADYLSAYGLNRKRLVAEGQKVKAGQAVAEMGNSAGTAGLLHFEVRRGGRPIDPLSVLPSR